MTGQERITAGHVWFDQMPDFEPWEKKRPVLIEVTTQHVIWADMDEGTAKEVADGPDVYERLNSENVISSWMNGYEVEYGSDWWEVYDQLGYAEPPNAPVQGPTWRCPDGQCSATHPAGASYERRHYPRCPHFVEEVAA
jgi:hypothetical protein